LRHGRIADDLDPISELSVSPMVHLKQMWTEEHARWQKRDLSAMRFVYCWADGSISRPG
jgi:hypothetical protein